MSDYKPKKKRKREWCSGGGEVIERMPYGEAIENLVEPTKTKVKYVRCAVCNQRFEIWNDKDYFFYDNVKRRVPKHKAY